MSAYYATDTGFLSRRAIVFVAIIVLHLLVIYAFATGLANNGVRYVATILQTNIIQTDKPKDVPPPPPPVELKERPPVQVVAPDINISIPADAPPPPITNITTQPAPPPPPRAQPAPSAPLTYTYKPDPNDYYPESSRRAGEEGRTLVKVCVAPSGKIASADLAQSSGFPALDEAAVKYAKTVRFKARPDTVCSNMPVKFQLHSGNEP